MKKAILILFAVLSLCTVTDGKTLKGNKFDFVCRDSQFKNPFVDVAESNYFYNAVLWAVENGITDGIDDTHFAPKSNCTRAQIVTFLYRDLNEL